MQFHYLIKYSADIIAFPFVITNSEFYFYPIPVWKADSSSFTVVIPPEDPLAVPVGDTEIYQVSADGVGVILGAVGGAEFFGGDLMIFGDVTTAAYYLRAGDPEDNRQELVLSNLDGTSPRSLAVGDIGAYEFAWSPEDARLLFANRDVGLYIIQVNDSAGNMLQVAPGEIFTRLKWINAQYYASWQNSGGVWQLMLGEVDSLLRQVSDGLAIAQDYDGVLIHSVPYRYLH